MSYPTPDDHMGDYERYILGGDRRTDPEAWAERQLAGGDHQRKRERENSSPELRTTPSGAIIDVSTCWCGVDATWVVGVYAFVGPIEVPVCDQHRDSLIGELEVRPIPKAG